MLGSVIGIALGIGLGLAFSRVAMNPDGTPTFPVSFDAILYGRSALLAIGVGLASAMFPARRAARMNPADTIRAG